MSAPPGREIPPYARVVADIRARIAAAELGPGDRVPSTREITRDWGVAMATATKALAALRQEGLVEAVRGVGTVVRDASTRTPVEPPERAGPPEPRTRRRESPRTTAGGGSHHGSEATLTREVVVRAAIDVADAEGIDGLSMRRVSSELRVTTMALYRHVGSKDELVTAMVDTIHREAPLPDLPPADWRRALELAMQWEWGIFRDHPWIARLTPAAGPVLSPGLMANTEWMLGVITAQGRSPDAALQVITILAAYTSGMALQAEQAVVEEHELGLDAEQWWKFRAPEFARLAAEGRFPVMFSVSGPPDVDEVFTVGMQRLLDGLAPLIAPEHPSVPGR